MHVSPCSLPRSNHVITMHARPHGFPSHVSRDFYHARPRRQQPAGLGPRGVRPAAGAQRPLATRMRRPRCVGVSAATPPSNHAPIDHINPSKRHETPQPTRARHTTTPHRTHTSNRQGSPPAAPSRGTRAAPTSPCSARGGSCQSLFSSHPRSRFERSANHTATLTDQSCHTHTHTHILFLKKQVRRRQHRGQLWHGLRGPGVLAERHRRPALRRRQG